MTHRHAPVLETLRAAAHVLDGGAHDDDPLLAMVGDRDFVLLGEATHGTHEFYAMRARITRRLVEEHGFDAVAASTYRARITIMCANVLKRRMKRSMGPVGGALNRTRRSVSLRIACSCP